MLVPARPHVCARPLHQTTIESDSSKVEVVEKKLLLLPNFDQLKHSRCKEPLSSRCLPCNCQYQSAFSRPFRCMFNPKTRICSFEYMLAFFGGKNSKRCFQPTCPPSCSNTRRSDFNMSTLRMRNYRPNRDSNVLLLTDVPLELFKIFYKFILNLTIPFLTYICRLFLYSSCITSTAITQL